jgi:hypothetical protein
VEVDVGAAYDTPPNVVKATILDALAHEPSISHDHGPFVLVADFGASAIVYRLWVWSNDFGKEDQVKDCVRSLVYYAFRRRGITIPYPVQVNLPYSDAGLSTPRADATAALEHVEIFAALELHEVEALRAVARSVLYAAGEPIVKQGQAGSSMFVLVSGEAKVTIEPGHEVSRFAGSGFFGEMSLLTGEPRSATVTAVSDCLLLEITADAFRQFVLANPAALDHVGAATSARASHLAALRASKSSAAGAPAEAPDNFVSRVRRFLRLNA